METNSENILLDTDKYDRQIRLFGLHTQKTLQNCSVTILGAANLTSAEVLKNTVLLGVKDIRVAYGIIKECKRIVPDDLKEINEHVNIQILDDISDNSGEVISATYNDIQIDNKTSETGEDPNEPSYFTFVVDQMYRPETDFYSICTKCKFIKKNSPCHGLSKEVCRMKDETTSPEVYCLLGSIAVQEFLKHIQKRESILEYKLNF